MRADAIDALVTAGLQVLWARDIGRRVLLLREAAVVVADSDLSRDYVANAALGMWQAPPAEPRQAQA